MAKYDVEYSCGHTGTVELYGPNRDRERKLEWMAEGVCPDCYRAEKHVERQAILQPLGELAALTGSEKQIAWAEDLREKAVAEYMEQGRVSTIKPEYRELALGWLAQVVNKQQAAKWWIDNRSRLYTLLDKALVAAAATYAETHRVHN